ncbi:Protease inhibitor/seed storage/lipid transfer family protein [Rhynchospora pubera]|uniref:Protease inhibitor/seed storage/lipid transfer family protein n=1 Tax=Rhynchospora pubera TaxID=906938 RepID=A0AAV8DZR7_9POAL|nr:Protease inhibitor/seed storage/lipid transfer family protein [Rhynchospora pubera]
MAISHLQPSLFLLLSALLFLSIPTPPLSVQAQSSSSTPSCASKLTGCASYINSTNPPDSCCSPLKEAITNELACLCAIYESNILQQYGINVTAAQQLAYYCGINSGTNQCKAAAPSGTPTTPPPSKGAAARAVWIGMSGLIGLLAIFWSICA